MSTKAILAGMTAVLILAGYNLYKYEVKENRLTSKLDLTEGECKVIEAENRILRDRLNQLQNKPSYDDGYKDALIHMAGGTFQKGYDAAIKLVSNQDYSNGYHAAIKQFGYQGEMLVPATYSPTKKEECPAHFGPVPKK